jgi:Protein of unknown function (DUF2946)
VKHSIPTISRRIRRRAALLAMFAVVLNGLAPTVTALVAQSSGRAMAITEHCLKIAEQSDAQSSSPASPSDNKDKKVTCPFCFAHAGSFGLVPADVAPQVAVFVLSAHRQLLAVPAAAGRPWISPQPRGPPVFA